MVSNPRTVAIQDGESDPGGPFESPQLGRGWPNRSSLTSPTDPPRSAGARCDADDRADRPETISSVWTPALPVCMRDFRRMAAARRAIRSRKEPRYRDPLLGDRRYAFVAVCMRYCYHVHQGRIIATDRRSVGRACFQRVLVRFKLVTRPFSQPAFAAYRLRSLSEMGRVRYARRCLAVPVRSYFLGMMRTGHRYVPSLGGRKYQIVRATRGPIGRIRNPRRARRIVAPLLRNRVSLNARARLVKTAFRDCPSFPLMANGATWMRIAGRSRMMRLVARFYATR